MMLPPHQSLQGLLHLTDHERYGPDRQLCSIPQVLLLQIEHAHGTVSSGQAGRSLDLTQSRCSLTQVTVPKSYNQACSSGHPQGPRVRYARQLPRRSWPRRCSQSPLLHVLHPTLWSVPGTLLCSTSQLSLEAETIRYLPASGHFWLPQPLDRNNCPQPAHAWPHPSGPSFPGPQPQHHSDVVLHLKEAAAPRPGSEPQPVPLEDLRSQLAKY
mmetsp:Transcript_29118/g.53117  ORF Transcript_29118/g.53117 Transcript_29118/m.53117 type:complete len:213 (+) Transcript_29118:674-1312(+)